MCVPWVVPPLLEFIFTHFFFFFSKGRLLFLSGMTIANEGYSALLWHPWVTHRYECSGSRRKTSVVFVWF